MTKLVRTSAMFVALVALNVGAPPARPQCAAPATMDGVWRANDGGTYTVRAVGTSIWWIGRSADGGRTWQNVFHGTRSGNMVSGPWADVGSRTRGAGTLTLRISGTTFMERTANTGSGFGGTRWSRGGCNDVQLNPVDE